MPEIKHVIYYPSICLKHILGWVKDTDNIIELQAFRSWKDKSEKKEPELPFVIHRKTTDERLYINFQGYKRARVQGSKIHYGFFPVNKTLHMIEKCGAKDMVLNRISILNTDKDLYNMFSGVDSKYGSFTREPDKKAMVITFRAVVMKDRPEFIMKLIERFMGSEIHDLKFQPETFDLVGLQTYAQWYFRDFRNFLPEDDIKILKKCIDNVFDTSNRFIRTYVRRQKGMWVLQETKPF